MITSGKEFQPSLPEFYKLCLDLMKNEQMRKNAQPYLEHRRDKRVGEYGMAAMKYVVKQKGGTMLPWLREQTDLSADELRQWRDNLISKGVNADHLYQL